MQAERKGRDLLATVSKSGPFEPSFFEGLLTSSQNGGGFDFAI